jgi:hypothetical protein
MKARSAYFQNSVHAGQAALAEKMGRQAAGLKTCDVKFMYLFIKARSSMYTEVLS